ncbi:MAG TPA: dephospho-CoA kinase [Solirubrobacteraceae bacterium]|nr:dephospho-CoA kinase [Solirubrobacteraceae bacterium]
MASGTGPRRRRPAPASNPTHRREAPPTNPIPFVGLTGGIGAGKSTALDALERVGAAVLSTDRVVHELYEDDDVLSAVRERFGDAIERDGVVDRAAIARRAFATDEDRAWLEGLLWPRVGARMASWRAALSASAEPPRAAVVEVPLLFESGMEEAFDATIAVVADEDLRASRAGARGHEALAERSARQLTQQEKAQRATYVVVNEGTVEELESKLSALLEKLGS